MAAQQRKRTAGPPASERHFSLVLALLLSERGLTKSDIFATVHGYASGELDDRARAAREKQFDRDKAELRDLGVPVDSLEDPASPGDNHGTRYRVAPGAYAMPGSISFDADETALLAMAAQVWREGSVSQESRRGLMKLKARGEATRDDLIGIAPRLVTRDQAFDPLSRAIAEDRAVEFLYLKPGDEAARLRRVEPLALIFADAHWLLVSFDLERGAKRNFLLERILSPVRVAGQRERTRFGGGTSSEHGAAALAELAELTRRQRATVSVRPGSDAELRLGADAAPRSEGGWPSVELGYSDLSLLADRLASFGADVRVRQPQRLRELVVARFERLLSDHGGTDREESP